MKTASIRLICLIMYQKREYLFLPKVYLFTHYIAALSGNRHKIPDFILNLFTTGKEILYQSRSVYPLNAMRNCACWHIDQIRSICIGY